MIDALIQPAATITAALVAAHPADQTVQAAADTFVRVYRALEEARLQIHMDDKHAAKPPLTA
jgi:hypothetical protein